MLRASALAVVIVLSAVLLHAAPRASADGTLHAVSGVVVDDLGAPREGIAVSGYTATSCPYDGTVACDSTQTSDKAQTDAGGRFVLHLGDGTGSVQAYDPTSGASDAREINVSGSDVTGLRLVLPAPRATIEGRVLAPDGQPIEGAAVSLGQGCCYAMATPAVAPSGSGSSGGAAAPSSIARPIYCCGGGYQQATTGADGKFRFQTRAGPWTLTATAKGYAQTSVQVEAKDNETVTQDVKMTKVPKADAVVRGRVVDARTGAPIANAGVSLSNLEWGRYQYNTTGADGAFRLTTLPGWSQITVYANSAPVAILAEKGGAADMPIRAPEPTYYQYIRTLRLASGENDVDVQLEPKPAPSIAIVGYAVDPDNKTGVAGATVTLWNQDTGDWGSAQTDKTGSYRILVRAGHFTVNAYAPGHLAGALTFAVADGASEKRVDVEIPAGETHYAPCDDTGDCAAPPPMPMMAGAKEASAPAAGTPTSAAIADASGQAAGPDTTKAAAYSGSGGGLPPYRPPADAPGAPTVERTNAVPLAGGALALATLGAVAALLRRAKE